MLEAEDLSPLGLLPSLESIELNPKQGQWRNLSALLELPKLKLFRYFANNIGEQDVPVLHELVKRNVLVHPLGEKPLKTRWFGKWW